MKTKQKTKVQSMQIEFKQIHAVLGLLFESDHMKLAPARRPFPCSQLKPRDRNELKRNVFYLSHIEFLQKSFMQRRRRLRPRKGNGVLEKFTLMMVLYNRDRRIFVPFCYYSRSTRKPVSIRFRLPEPK